MAVDFESAEDRDGGWRWRLPTIAEWVGAAVAGIVLTAVLFLFDHELRHAFDETVSVFTEDLPREANAAPLLAAILLYGGSTFIVLLVALVVRARRGEMLPPRLQSWPRSIFKTIDQTRGFALKRLLREFLYAYATQESMQIGGGSRRVHKKQAGSPPRPRQRIYTSFVSYSELVKVLLRNVRHAGSASFIDRLRKRSPEPMVCYAIISMPLPQWFNNKLHSNPTFAFTEVDPVWDGYLWEMRRLAKGEVRGAPTIYRLLQVRPEGHHSIGAFYDEAAMRRHASGVILTPLAEGIPDYTAIHAYTAQERDALLGRIRRTALRRYAESLYEGSPLAYIILPGQLPTGCELEDIPGFCWTPVWKAFVALFSSSTEGKAHAYVKRIGDEEFLEMYRGDHGVPNDAFVVGKGSPGKRRKWLFYLAGATDEGCQMVRLEYATDSPDDERIAKIRTSADRCLEQIEAPGFAAAGSDGPILELSRWMGA